MNFILYFLMIALIALSCNSQILYTKSLKKQSILKAKIIRLKQTNKQLKLQVNALDRITNPPDHLDTDLLVR